MTQSLMRTIIAIIFLAPSVVVGLIGLANMAGKKKTASVEGGEIDADEIDVADTDQADADEADDIDDIDADADVDEADETDAYETGEIEEGQPEEPGPEEEEKTGNPLITASIITFFAGLILMILVFAGIKFMSLL